MYRLKLYKVLRIAFCILSVAAAAVAVPVFIFLDLWGLVPVGIAAAGDVLMMVFKNAQEREERKLNPPPPEGDFIRGKVKKDK